MTRFRSSLHQLAVHSNLLLKRKLPKECEQHALRDAAADVSVRVRYRGHVRAHLRLRERTIKKSIIGVKFRAAHSHHPSPYRYLPA